MQRDDTTEDDAMQAYVVDNWKSKVKGGPYVGEKKGRTGNVVPFFPTDWKKNANEVFNMIMEG